VACKGTFAPRSIPKKKSRTRGRRKEKRKGRDREAPRKGGRRVRETGKKNFFAQSKKKRKKLVDPSIAKMVTEKKTT